MQAYMEYNLKHATAGMAELRKIAYVGEVMIFTERAPWPIVQRNFIQWIQRCPLNEMKVLFHRTFGCHERLIMQLTLPFRAPEGW